ncbi:Protein kinase domain-containing protein [Aphelenchoides besseyi]|nr:Protein kinase domain-containing protein [Aphelenchoides besseyi]
MGPEFSAQYMTPDYFDSLKVPDDVIALIFENLQVTDLVHAIQTCTRFYTVGLKASAWKRMNLSQITIGQSALHRVMERKSEVICLYGATVFHDEIFYPPVDIPDFTMLTFLDVSYLVYDDPKTMSNLLSRTCSLQVIVEVIARRCPGLIEIDLSDCSEVTSAGLEKLTELTDLKILQLDSLEALNLHGCVTDDGVAYIRKELAPTLMFARLGFFAVRPKLQPSIAKSTARAARNLQTTRRFFTRVLNATLRTKFAARPFAALPHGRRDPSRRYSILRANRRFVRFDRQFQFFDQIKALFAGSERYNRELLVDELPVGLANYEIGNFIACGCNAAVYELVLKTDFVKNRHLSPSIGPLALKLIFNYDFSLPERQILRETKSELIPFVNASNYLLTGTFGSLKRSHPNVIKIYTAFVDRMPLLDGADRLYPEALPTADIYRMTLREYCLTRKRNYWAARVMFGQLLEAIVFLYDSEIVHRDIKSDNVLLDFNSDDEIPHLVLSDFGSAMSNSLTLRYENEFTNLGGNISLRAPEISRTKLMPGVVLDYSLADLWSCGTLGYEIFTRRNPFYSYLNSVTYNENDLPDFPRRVPSTLKTLIAQILRVDPKERPSPHVAANIVSLSLFRFGQKKLDDMIGLFVAETISARLISPAIISPSELQLRATFLSRIDRTKIWMAVEHMIESTAHDLEPSSSRTISSAESDIMLTV